MIEYDTSVRVTFDGGNGHSSMEWGVLAHNYDGEGSVKLTVVGDGDSKKVIIPASRVIKVEER